MSTLQVTKEQRSNLARLALHLRTQKPSDEFDMIWYAENKRGQKVSPYAVQKHPCGTTCCAIGTGPKIGIKAKRGEDWDSYGDRVFIDACANGCAKWGFMFAGHHDDIPYLAAKRIAWLLCDKDIAGAHGIPRGFKEWRPNWKKLEVMVNA
jgi:hypothetical protein